MITNENYFSPENQMKYMGSSQFKAFQKCEAAALAEIKGEYERKITPSLLVGQFVDAYFEKTLDIFKAKNPQIFTLKGELKAEYKQAERIIERIEKDELFMEYMSGAKQVILTGEIEGVPVKIKIDSYHEDKIVDMKIMKDLKPIWVEEKGLLTFAEAWGYDIQGAIYKEIEGNDLPFILAVATKEEEPDLELIEIPKHYLDASLEIVKSKIVRYDAIKKGLIEPNRCGKCDYCKRTKKLQRVISLEELEYAE